MREDQILNCLKCSEGPISSLQVVEKVYKDMKLNIILKLSAQGSVVSHLNKLKREDKVKVHWPDLWSLC